MWHQTEGYSWADSRRIGDRSHEGLKPEVSGLVGPPKGCGQLPQFRVNFVVGRIGAQGLADATSESTAKPLTQSSGRRSHRSVAQSELRRDGARGEDFVGPPDRGLEGVEKRSLSQTAIILPGPRYREVQERTRPATKVKVFRRFGFNGGDGELGFFFVKNACIERQCLAATSPFLG